MSKEYTSLGLMSGTSGDGIDASIIKSDGISKYEVLFNKYYKYQDDIYENIHSIKEKINNTKDLKNFTKDLKNLERKITMYHVEVVSEISKKYLGKSIKHYIRASGSPCHYSYNKSGEVYKFDKEGNITNP